MGMFPSDKEIHNATKDALARCERQCERLTALLARSNTPGDCCDAAMRERLGVDAVSLNREQGATIGKLLNQLATAKRDMVAKVKEMPSSFADDDYRAGCLDRDDVIAELEKELI